MTEEEIEELIAELLEVESKVKCFDLLGLEKAAGALYFNTDLIFSGCGSPGDTGRGILNQCRGRC